MLSRAVAASTLSVAAASPENHFAVLVAGSYGFLNYRHQADVCHAYHVLKAQGMPEENIILMAYDDIANHERNPFPGKLYNKPDPTGPGVDVYAGCKIDYKGDDVTPENFEKVMTGTASGKSLKSTAADNVFVFFSDHGAPGLISFPQYVDMHKSDFQKILQTMSDKKMFKKLTFYLETCESGSMFEGLNIPGLYALSAAGPDESSWAAYCGDDAVVNGQNIESCLGDVFSVSWMENADTVDLATESLKAQFKTVKKLTTQSQVMQWGDLSFDSDMAIEHEGGGANAVTPLSAGVESSRTTWSARELELKQKYYHYMNAQTSEERLAAGEEMQHVLADQLAVETAFESFLNLLYPGDVDKQAAIREANSPPDNRDCELNTRQSFKQYGKFDASSNFANQFHKYIVNVCADEAAANVDLAQVAKLACLGETVV